MSRDSIPGLLRSFATIVLSGTFVIFVGQYTALSGRKVQYDVTAGHGTSSQDGDTHHSPTVTHTRHTPTTKSTVNVTSSASHIYKHYNASQIPGLIFVNMTEPSSIDSIPSVLNSKPPVEMGGRWRPADGIPRCHLAVVMTYRNRLRNLKLMLQHLHPFLQEQRIAYQFFIVEPPPEMEFNRGILKNIGFMEATKDQFSCVVFQDLDLMPENIHNFYCCRDRPQHLVIAIDTYNYHPFHKCARFGGAVIFNTSQFRTANGYSNLYFSWGGEDDDLLYRVKDKNMGVMRRKVTVGRYKEALHKKEDRPVHNRYLYNMKEDRFNVDGLNALEYSLIDRKEYPAYTWLNVNVSEEKYKQQAAKFLEGAENDHRNRPPPPRPPGAEKPCQ